MQRLSLGVLAVLALAALPATARAQKASDSRPAVMPFGALGHDGQAAIGAGLRLFPTAETPAPQPIPAPQPAAAATVAPVAKPGLGAVPQPAAGGPGKPAALPPLGAPARPARSATAFATDPAVSARVRDQVLAATLPSSPNPAGLRQAVQSGAPWAEFDRLLVQHAYDPRDLSDVVAAFYLIAWEVSTGGDATAQPAGIAAVRGQARQMLAGMPNVARMTDADRQATAETLAFHAMAMVARHQDLRMAGPGALTAYRNEVAQSVAQQQGIDLRRFALTPAGFQPR